MSWNGFHLADGQWRPYGFQMGRKAQNSEHHADDVDKLYDSLEDEDVGRVLMEELFQYNDQAEALMIEIRNGRRYPRLSKMITSMYAHHRRSTQVAMKAELQQKNGGSVEPTPIAQAEQEAWNLAYAEPFIPETPIYSYSELDEPEEWQESDIEKVVRVNKEYLQNLCIRCRWMWEDATFKLGLRRNDWRNEPYHQLIREAISGYIWRLLSRGSRRQSINDGEEADQSSDWRLVGAGSHVQW